VKRLALNSNPFMQKQFERTKAKRKLRGNSPDV
jgi:hypothetical protein